MAEAHSTPADSSKRRTSDADDPATFVPPPLRLEEDDVGDVVNPRKVEAKSARGVDYEQLMSRFGTQSIDAKMIARFEKVTGSTAHHLLRRGIFFSHRDLDDILTRHENRDPFFLYTGRGPSSEAMHIGHLIPFKFTKWLQDTLDVPLVIQLTDDEEFFWKTTDIDIKDTHKLAYENAKDIIAVGFDPAKTFIFANTDYIKSSPNFYPTICRILNYVTIGQAKDILGLKEDSHSIGKIAFPAIQAAPSYSSAFPQIFGERDDIPSLVPCAIDQDSHFRIIRDVMAQKLGYPKPALIHCKFVPSLRGAQYKMSSSDHASVYLSDDRDTIKQKINDHAFPGGGASVEEHSANDGDCDINIFNFLFFFLEDEKRLAQIEASYKNGEMPSEELKQELITLLQRIVAEHQASRNDVTDDDVKKFMTPRKLNYDY